MTIDEIQLKKWKTNHLVDEIDYETYDIDEYICSWKVQHGWKFISWMKIKNFDNMDDVDENYEYSWI